MNWSTYQSDIFKFIENEEQNGAIIALAGSGKTTVIEEGNNKVGNARTINLAFNTHIKEELTKRLPYHREVATLNALGWRIIRQNNANAVLNDGKDFQFLQSHFNLDNKEDATRFYKIQSAIKRSINLFKQLYLTEFPENWIQILDTYGVETGDFSEADQFAYWLEKCYTHSIENDSSYTFADQMFQVLYRDYPIPQRDVAFVDESQDLSPVQIEMVKRVAKRKILVGDPNQAIYIFRGADLNAIGRIISELDCVTLPLSICYRCDKSIIEAAKEYVPAIEARSDAPEGKCETITKGAFLKDVRDGDYVTCRNTSPLISQCLEFLRQKRKAYVRGRDIGEAIETLIWKVHARCGNNDRLNVFLPSLNDYVQMQTQSLMRSGRETECELLDDRAQSIHAFAEEGAETIGDVFKVMEQVFSDSAKVGIELTTIHKSKGMERPRVFRLRPDVCPGKNVKAHLMQIEYNLRYVEITRAKNELYTIIPEKKDR